MKKWLIEMEGEVMKERERAREREESEEGETERTLRMKRIQTVLENHCLHLSP